MKVSQDIKKSNDSFEEFKNQMKSLFGSILSLAFNIGVTVFSANVISYIWKYYVSPLTGFSVISAFGAYVLVQASRIFMLVPPKAAIADQYSSGVKCAFRFVMAAFALLVAYLGKTYFHAPYGF